MVDALFSVCSPRLNAGLGTRQVDYLLHRLDGLSQDEIDKLLEISKNKEAAKAASQAS